MRWWLWAFINISQKINLHTAKVVISTPVQFFMTWRIHIITGSKTLTSVLTLLTLVAFGTLFCHMNYTCSRYLRGRRQHCSLCRFSSLIQQFPATSTRSFDLVDIVSRCRCTVDGLPRLFFGVVAFQRIELPSPDFLLVHNADAICTRGQSYLSHSSAYVR